MTTGGIVPAPGDAPCLAASASLGEGPRATGECTWVGALALLPLFAPAALPLLQAGLGDPLPGRGDLGAPPAGRGGKRALSL